MIHPKYNICTHRENFDVYGLWIMMDRKSDRKLNTGRNAGGERPRTASGGSRNLHSVSARSADSKKKTSDEKNDLDDYSPAMQKQIKKEMKRIKFRRNLLIFCFSSAAVACIGYFVWYYASADQNGGRMEQLSGLVGSDAMSNVETGYVARISNEEDVERPDILDQYKTLYNSNKDIIGWITIPNTKIDYPVMQYTDNTYYLSHNFDRKDDKAGCLFMDCGCDVIKGSDNYIIYGHHLTSGRMFSSLSDYESKTFYEKHSTINFDTIFETGTYAVMYAFRSRVYDDMDVNFKYYQFINADSEEEFNSYMNEMKEASYYDTGVTAAYGDQLLTLSTCDYQEENGRFVVVAKKIR